MFPLGAGCFLTRDIPKGTFHNDRDKIEFARKIKAEKADDSPYNSCFVATSNLHKDDMCLPEDVTSLTCLKRKCINVGTKGDNNNKKFCMGMERNNNLLSPTNLTSPNKCKFMTLTLNSVISFKQFVSISFMIENGMTKPGKITLLGRDGTRWLVSLREEVVSRRLVFSKGWSMFSKANGLKEIGESFTFELIYENGTPLLCLLNKDSSSYDRSLIGECSKPAESSNVNKNRFMTLHVDLFRESTQHVAMSFMKDNNIHVPGKITLLGKDGSRWRVNLREKNRQRMILTKGWKNFAQANGLINTGESFTFELIYENGTPLLCLLNKDSTSYDRSLILIGKYVKAAEPPSSSRTKKREDKRESCSTIIGRFVTLTLTHEDVEDCILALPSKFMEDNFIKKVGNVTFLGENKTNWYAYMSTQYGVMAVGYGWKAFCENNGVNIGDTFTLELIDGEDTNVVFKFSA